MNENNKGAIIESLKRKSEKLEEGNKRLREQLKVAYADVIKKLEGRTKFSLLKLSRLV